MLHGYFPTLNGHCTLENWHIIFYSMPLIFVVNTPSVTPLLLFNPKQTFSNFNKSQCSVHNLLDTTNTYLIEAKICIKTIVTISRRSVFSKRTADVGYRFIGHHSIDNLYRAAHSNSWSNTGCFKLESD